MDVADTVIRTVTRQRVATIWRCPHCAEDECGLDCGGYQSEDEASGQIEAGDARKWLC